MSITIEECGRVVGIYCKVPRAIMVGASRKRKYAQPRMFAMVLAREFTGKSYPDIGARFGDRDHTTVMSAVRRVARLERESDEVREVMGHFRITLAHRHILGRP